MLTECLLFHMWIFFSFKIQSIYINGMLTFPPCGYFPSVYQTNIHYQNAYFSTIWILSFSLPNQYILLFHHVDTFLQFTKSLYIKNTYFSTMSILSFSLPNQYILKEYLLFHPVDTFLQFTKPNKH